MLQKNSGILLELLAVRVLFQFKFPQMKYFGKKQLFTTRNTAKNFKFSVKDTLKGLFLLASYVVLDYGIE